MQCVLSVAVILVASFLVAPIGCTSNERQSEFPTDDAKKLAKELWETCLDNKVDVEHAIQNARNAEQSVVFIGLRWSATSQWATFPYAQFMLDYNSSHPDSKLLFHYIDCTSLSDDYSPLTEIPGWHDSGAVIHGNGELAWLKNGRVLRVEPICGFRDFRSIEKLTTITDELMADP
jgi:hypothetical protein